MKADALTFTEKKPIDVFRTMSHCIPFEQKQLTPDPESVLRQMGVPRRATISAGARILAEEAVDELEQNLEPAGILMEISRHDFADIFKGEAQNASETPLELIFPQAQALAVYALTMGAKVCMRIDELFKSGDVALGGALDAAASWAANRGAAIGENFFHETLSRQGQLQENDCVLAYSPGYCGWHVSGQRQIFSHLRPETLGITLNDSYLMSPVKSVSGVMVAGKREINYYKPQWGFCNECVTFSCLQRMKQLKNAAKAKPDNEKQ